MKKEETAEDLARDIGQMRQRLLEIAKRNRQTAQKDRKAAPVPPAPKKPAIKRQVPPQLKPYLFRKTGKK